MTGHIKAFDTMLYCVILASALFGDVLSQCHEGWTYSESGTKCVKLFEDTKSWEEARKSCQQVEAELLMIRDERQRDFAHDLMKENWRPFWIGIWDGKLEGAHQDPWTFVDGSPVTKFFWHHDEPNNYKGREHCVHVKNKGWNDMRCNAEKAYMCEKDIKRCVDGWTYSKNESQCLKLFEEEKSWPDARVSCQAHNGDLVISRNTHEHDLAFDLMREKLRVWIGAKVHDHNNPYEHTITLVDGTKPEEDFRENKDNWEPKKCIYAYRIKMDKDWHSAACSMKIPYICETPALKAPKPTTTTTTTTTTTQLPYIFTDGNPYYNPDEYMQHPDNPGRYSGSNGYKGNTNFNWIHKLFLPKTTTRKPMWLDPKNPLYSIYQKAKAFDEIMRNKSPPMDSNGKPEGHKLRPYKYTGGPVNQLPVVSHQRSRTLDILLKVSIDDKGDMKLN